MVCSITGHYMPDNNNGTNTTLPALSGTCLPCEVRCITTLQNTRPEGLVLFSSCRRCVIAHWFCAILQINSFQNQTGQTRCILCPAGTSTSETGNAACQPCAHGYYSPNAGEATVHT